MKSEKEHKYTSTGIKFWRHKNALESYKHQTGCTVISTHISPEGACNLHCFYCSVSKRKIHSRIELPKIQDYVLRLKERGLQAVILTGGGEPTLYPHFNELVRWLKVGQGLSVALITNGTRVNNVPQTIWEMFAWIRVSLNLVDDWQRHISFPRCNGTLGASLVYTGQSAAEMQEIARFVSRPDIRYVRVLPNCLLEQQALLVEHEKIKTILAELSNDKFFQQFKVHGMPCCTVCHQAYFRPYLSEANGGTLYPCDSLVLNDACQHFADDYAICDAAQVLDFLDRKITMRFSPREKCLGCVFTDNLKLLDDWRMEGKSEFEKYTEPLEHEEFV
jgi:MoaA/NifB/PqqE/SkfB family radical SAM enzyme